MAVTQLNSMPKKEKADDQKFQFFMGMGDKQRQLWTEAEMRGSRKDHVMSSTSEGIHCLPGPTYYL